MKTNIHWVARGFTLIEILVVLSIISVLASVVLSSTTTSREKARIAAGLMLGSNLEHAYKSDAVALWDFDEDSGSAMDSSGNGKNATVNGAVRVTGIHGNAMQFDGATTFLSSVSSITVGQTWTFSAWVYPNTVAEGIFLYLSGFYFRINAGHFFISWWDPTATPTQRSMNETATRTVGKWYFVAATHQGNTTVLYVDGKEVNRNTTNLSGTVAGITYIGNLASSYFFNGVLDEVHMFTQSLLGTEIQNMYLAGKKTHAIAAR